MISARLSSSAPACMVRADLSREIHGQTDEVVITKWAFDNMLYTHFDPVIKRIDWLGRAVP